MLWPTSADQPAHLVPAVDQVVACDPPAAGGWAREGGQEPDERRLPGAVVAEDGEHLPRRDLERHAAERDVRSVELRESLSLDHRGLGYGRAGGPVTQQSRSWNGERPQAPGGPAAAPTVPETRPI